MVAGVVIFFIIFAGVLVGSVYYCFTMRAPQPVARSELPVAEAAGSGAMQGASREEKEGHQRFHDEDSDRF